MRILFAGASGTLGRALLPLLVGAGHDVLALTRNAMTAQRLAMARVTPIIADALDRDGLLAALRPYRADAVIGQLTALTKPPTHYRSMRPTNELRTVGTAHLVEAAHALGARRMLTQSIVFGYGYGAHPGVLDETAPFGHADGTGADATLLALAETERLVREAPGIEGIALRYGLFYGRDAETVRTGLRRRMLPAASGWPGAMPLVHHDAAATATLAALDRGEPGTAFDVVDDDPTQSWGGYLDEAASAFGVPRPMRVPASLLRVAAPYAARLIAGLDLRVSADRARRELGWTPRYPSAREGWRAEI